MGLAGDHLSHHHHREERIVRGMRRMKQRKPPPTTKPEPVQLPAHHSKNKKAYKGKGQREGGRARGQVGVVGWWVVVGVEGGGGGEREEVRLLSTHHPLSCPVHPPGTHDSRVPRPCQHNIYTDMAGIAAAGAGWQVAMRDISFGSSSRLRGDPPALPQAQATRLTGHRRFGHCQFQSFQSCCCCWLLFFKAFPQSFPGSSPQLSRSILYMAIIYCIVA